MLSLENEQENTEQVKKELNEQFEKYPFLTDSELYPRSNRDQLLFDVDKISTPYWQDVYRMCFVSTVLALIVGLFIWGIDLSIQMILKPIMFDGLFFGWN